MKTIIHLTICSLLFVTATACKNKKNATAASKTANQAAASTSSTPPAEDSYRLVVEFFSIGQGIDQKTQTDFEKLLSSNTKKIAYEPTHWGREGEVDYCLKLSELSTGEQAEFVKKTKEMLSTSKLVHISENAKCVHKH